MSKSREHRRRASRYPLRWKAAIVFEGAQRQPTLHTETLDLSTGGAAVYTDRDDLTGSIINLLLAPPQGQAEEVPPIIRARARVVSTQHTPEMTRYRHGLSFFRSPGDGLDALLAWMGSAAEPAPVSAPVTQAPTSRLEQLRKLAEAKSQESPKVDPQAEMQARISHALESAHGYLKDLVEQLNKLHPAYTRGYGIAGLPEFSGLEWDKGHADFHTREISSTVKLFDRVSLRYRLTANKQIKVSREYPAAERLKQLLEDCDIKFHAHGARNKHGSLERTSFTFPCEVDASLLFSGQFDTGKLLLRARNVSGFGIVEQVLSPEAITKESLDELTGFILGETGALGPLLTRGA